MDDARIQRLKEQKADLEKQVEINPLARGHWVQLGNICRQLGDKDRAIEALRKALELKPDDSFTQGILADLEGKGRPAPIAQPKEIRLFPTAPAETSASHFPSKMTISIVVGVLLVIGFIAYKIWHAAVLPDPHLLAVLNNDLRHPRISPDGKLVAYQASPSESDHSGTTTIYTVTPDGKINTPRLYETDGLEIAGGEPAWLPDGSGFLIQVKEKGGDYTYMVVSVSGAANATLPLKRVPLSYFSPAISPDGKYIAYVSRKKEENNKETLVVSSIGTGETSEIVDMREIKTPVWSPDGSLIAFCETHYDGNARKANLVSVNYISRETKVLDEVGYCHNIVFFGAKEPMLVYPKKDSLYTISASSPGTPQKLLPGEYDKRIGGDLSVSGDLRVLAFSAVVGNVNTPVGTHTVEDVFLLEEGKTDPVQAIETHKGKFDPGLSQDGKTMAFCRWVMSPNAQVWLGSTALK